LNEAKQLVDELKRKAAEQSQQLAIKQSEADNALKEITVSNSILVRLYIQREHNKFLIK
jgi:hypothetical protein